MFFKPYTISLNRVHDRIAIREGGEKLILTVDADPMRMAAEIMSARRLLDELTETSTDEELNAAADAFAVAMFGTDQAERLREFYRGDGKCILNVCARYFHDRLAGKITAAQKRVGRK